MLAGLHRLKKCKWARGSLPISIELFCVIYTTDPTDTNTHILYYCQREDIQFRPMHWYHLRVIYGVPK